MTLQKFSRDQLVASAWHKGDLTYKLYSAQRDIKEKFTHAPGRVFVVCCSRRLGKSYLALVLAIEACLKQKRAQVRYAAPQKTMVRNIIMPLMEDILEDCPKEWKPAFHRQDGVYTFPNGSELHIAGCDAGGSERLRGVSTDLAIVDEAGFVGGSDGNELEYVAQDILLPQTLTTDGKVLLISTPSRTPEHAFVKVYCPQAEAEGRYVHKNIYEALKGPIPSPKITEERIEELKKSSGGADNTTWQREYLAQVVADEELMVLPEVLQKRDTLVQDIERPEFYDSYVGADFGFSDFTAIVFGYYHFPLAKVVIEDELVFQRTNSGKVAKACLAKELELWGAPPKLRVGDATNQLRADLAADHGLTFRMPKKDDTKEAMVNQLRLLIQKDGLIVHPRCVNTIAHLQGAVWNRERTKFARSGALGHFDFVDAVLYLVRFIRQGGNPFPLYRGVSIDTHHIPPKQNTERAEKIRSMIIPRKRRR